MIEEIKKVMSRWTEDKIKSNEAMIEIHNILYPVEKPKALVNGWICQKCGKSWAWWVAGCKNCNEPKVFTTSSSSVS